MGNRKKPVHYYGASSIEKIPLNWPKWLRDLLDELAASDESKAVQVKRALAALDQRIDNAEDWQRPRLASLRAKFVEISDGLLKRKA